MIRYANKENRDRWLRHPAMGDASYDAFEKIGGTVHRSEPPYEWAVNGSLFGDFDGAWYLYAGLYPYGYAAKPDARSHFEIYKSPDKGASWTYLGRGFPDSGFCFDGYACGSNGSPDVVLAWDPKLRKYLLAYDWSTDNFTWDAAHGAGAAGVDSGAAIALADSPAGPFRRLPVPTVSNNRYRGCLGRYDRMYGTTVLPRSKDYIALILCDSGKNFAWGLACMTGETADGAWTAPKMLLSCDRAGYYPAPMEFYPAFTVGDTVYAPATSVAANRNYQFVFSAPLERAHEPDAWQMAFDGGVWHARAIPDERYGIWGQTFSGFVDGEGEFRVMYPSRDARGYGTLSVASRKWAEPYKDGFTLSGHDAPTVSLLTDAYECFRLDAEFTLSGAADFLFGFDGEVGADRAEADCAPCESALSEYDALRVCEKSWAYVSHGAILASGYAADVIRAVRVEREPESVCLYVNGAPVLRLKAGPAKRAPIGVRTARFSVLDCALFDVEGAPEGASFTHNRADALLGGGVGLCNFRVANGEWIGGMRVKWNVRASCFTLFASRGPGLSKAEVRVDGAYLATVDFGADAWEQGALYASPRIADGTHGVELIPLGGEIAVPKLIARV